MSDSAGQITAYIRFSNAMPIRGCYACIIQNEQIVWQSDRIAGLDDMTIRLNDPKGPGAHFPKDGITCNVGFKLDPTGHETFWTHDNPVTYAWNGNTAYWSLDTPGEIALNYLGNHN